MKFLAVDALLLSAVLTMTSRAAQEAYLKASNTGGGDEFGYTVAMSGDTVVIGAPRESSDATGVNGNQGNNNASQSGAAYVFVRNGSVWTQQAYLKASNTQADDQFGFSVGVSGNTIVVGAPFEASSATGINGNGALNGAAYAGAAYVFVRNGTTWSQQAYLKASNTNTLDGFGWSVAVSGDTAVVAAFGENSSATGVNGDQTNSGAGGSGAAYVFVRNGTTWSQQAYLKASNTGASDDFGNSVAISGGTIVVGAELEDSPSTGVNGLQNNGATDSGAAYVFTRSGTAWSQQAYLKASNTNAGDNFGFAVAISGETAVVSALREAGNAPGVNGDQTNNSLANAGAAYVFARSGTTWTQQAYLKAAHPTTMEQFGTSVAVDGDTIAVGAPGEDSNATGIDGNSANTSLRDAGAVFVFGRSAGAWSQQAYVKASNTDADDLFGISVALSGGTLVAGAQYEDGASTGVNGNQTNRTAAFAGAAYVYAGVGAAPVPITTWRQQYFGSTANSGNGADAFDFDRDGLPNLIEYAFGLNPTRGDSVQLPQGVRNGSNFVVSFPQAASVTGITYGAERTTNLQVAPWTTVTDTGTGSQHVFSVPMGANAKVYVRLRVTVQ